MRQCLRIFSLAACALVLAVAGAAAGSGASASGWSRPGTEAITYPSGPGGVILEGSAAGMAPPALLGFNGKSNSFTLDSTTLYRNPVSWAEWVEIITAIEKDDRLGVSLTMNMSLITFGGLSPRSKIAKDLERADRLFAGICFGVPRLLNGATLPGDYQPVRVAKREQVVACFNITNFTFGRVQDEYQRNNCDLQVFMLSVYKQKAPDGGHLADEEATERIEKEVDWTNINHLKDNQVEYLKLPILARAAAFGEAAAFARFLRDNGFSLAAMRSAMSVRNPAGVIEPMPMAVSVAVATDTKVEQKATPAAGETVTVLNDTVVTANNGSASNE